jgi:glycosyltransferase involved in cell wall biosynthesis
LWIFIPSFKCKYITVISEKTRDDFINVCPWARGKTTIIPDPISPLFKYSEKEFNITRPKILLIGTSQNKNHERIIKAIRNINCELIIVGKLSEEEKRILNRENILFSNYYMISEDEIVELYKLCDIVLFPSTYEGFGMPIIEGQRTGRCVITSNLEPMKSVAGGAACLVNPYDVRDIEQGILKVINDKAYRDKLIENGLINSDSYSSDKIAALYEDVYRRIEH